MGKLIDTDMFVNEIMGEPSGEIHYPAWCMDKVKKMPEAVVRCKDCGFYDTSEKDVFCKSLCKCKNLGCYMGANEFCSSGVRRK